MRMYATQLSIVVALTWAGVLSVQSLEANGKTPPQPGQLAPDNVRGADLYEVNCWMCHGKKGLGDGPAAKSLRTTVPALAGRVSDSGVEAAADIVMQGSGDMPGYMETLNRKDAIRILNWLNGLDPATGEDKE